MISLFANVPSNASPEAVQTQLVSAAVSKTPVPLPATVAPKRGFKWFSFGNAKKRLQMVESVSLGEKRFVALVKVDGRQFLIGGAPSNVGMLAELAPEETFHQVLKDATQGLDIALPISASPSKTAEKAAATVQLPAVVPEPVIAQDPAASLEPFRTPVAVPSAPFTLAPVAESVAARNVAAPAKTGPEDVPAPVDPIVPVDPVDLASEEPLSFSPSLVAAMEARRTTAETPAPKLVLQEVGPVIPPVTKVEPVAEKIVEERTTKAETVPAVRNTRSPQAPQFTFQVSHLFNPSIKAA